MKIRRLAVAWFVTIGATTLGVSPRAQAVGTGFTYQGQVVQSGSPVNGSCDVQFSLFPVVSGGVQIGSTLTQNNVTVTNGVFTTQLDFGGTAFDGSDRFLQLAARCPTGSGGFNTLSPRQQVTATPYALFSQNIPDAVVTNTKLSSNAVDTTQVKDNAITSAKIADGTIASADVGFNFAGSSSKGGPASDLSCATCVDATEVSPTGSATGQVLTSNGSAVSWQNQVGFTLPSAQTGGAATAAFAITNTTNASGAHALEGYAPSGGDGVIGQSDRSDGNGVRGISLGVSGIGTVGINLNPAASVPYADAAGSGVFGYANTTASSGVVGESASSTGIGVRGETSSTTGTFAGARGVYGVARGTSGQAVGVFGNSLSPSGIGVLGTRGGVNQFVSPAGVVGAATSAFGIEGVSDQSEGVHGQSINGTGVKGYTSTGSFGVYGQSDNGNGVGVRGFSPSSGDGVQGITTSGNAMFGQSSSGTGVFGSATGASGIGLQAVQSISGFSATLGTSAYAANFAGPVRLGGTLAHVNPVMFMRGDPSLGQDAVRVLYDTPNRNAFIDVRGSGLFIRGNSSGNGDTNLIAADLATGNVSVGFPDVGNDRLAVNGTVFAKGFKSTCVTPPPLAPFLCLALDLAETFVSEVPTEPGDLVALAPVTSDKATVRLANAAYDDAIVGIVSDTAGIVFDEGLTRVAGDNAHLITPTKTVVGVVGRVRMKFSTENGLVAVGDPLTSSTKAGIAMRASKAGKIVGYALEPAVSDGKVLTWLQPGHYLPPKLLAKLNQLLDDDE
jgi:hypothetical protein